MFEKLFLVAALVFATLPAQALEVANSILSIGTSGGRGSSLDSLKVLGTETVNNGDFGRQIQGSYFFMQSQMPYGMGATCYQTPPPWLNPTDSGDQCGNPSVVYGLGASGHTLNVGAYPKEWHGRGQVPGMMLEGHHSVGPFDYAPFNEVAQLVYMVRWESAYPGQPQIDFTHAVGADNGATPVPFIPAAYFDSNLLPRLFGLAMDGSGWREVTDQTHQSNGNYAPSNYRFRAMAYMRQDLGWGVALYGRWTLDQNCHGVNFPMALPEQAGQCPNFAAQRYPALGTNNVSIVDQTLTSLPVGQYTYMVAHAAIGGLGTLQAVINQVYNAGR